jgi:CelD/BcsL family acetyltransferase involved in cellulose biosynthesis/glycosyltransferase involved in cell wall biosynthesis
VNVVLVAWSLARVGPDAIGGAEQVLWNLERGLARRGHRTLTIAGEGSRVAGELAPLPIPEGMLDALAQAQQHERVRAVLRRTLASHPVDLVHVHGVDFDHYLPPPGPPLLVTLHLPRSWYADAALAPPRPRTWLHCVSASQRRTFPDGAVLADDVPNGIAVELFRPARRKARFALALGRVSPEKGFDAGLAAARRAGASMVLAGRVFPFPAHERHFRRRIAPLLDERRIFIGPVNLARKRRLLAAARCLVVSSTVPETSSIAAMEALASGTPVVAFRVGALPEVVEEGRTGFIVDSVAELADAILAAGRISPEDCRRAAEERFSADAMVERYLALYRRVLDASAGVRVAGEVRVERGSTLAPLDGETVGERPSSLVVDELAGLDALERLRPAWEALWAADPRATAFQHPSWVIAWCRRFWPRPFALAARADGRLVSLAVLHAHTWRGRRLVQLAGGPLADVQDLLAEPIWARDAAAAFLGRLAARAASGETVELEPVLDGSPLLEIPPGARSAPPGPRSARFADRVEAMDSSPELALPRSVEELRRVAPVWSDYRYERRRAERLARLDLELATTATLAEVFEEWARLHRERWTARGEPGGVLSDDRVLAFHRDAARGLLERGALRLRLLRRDGVAVAALYGWEERGVAVAYIPGMDPAAGALSPGKIVMGEAVEAAVRSGARAFSFLRGREAYKYRWGARDRLLFRRRLDEARAPRADEVGAEEGRL